MEITKDNIFKEADNKILDILNSPLVDILKDSGWTPLHIIAGYGKIEVLLHPSVDKVKNLGGRTPLHCLASAGNIEVLDHKSVDKVSDDKGEFPLHDLAWAIHLEMLSRGEYYYLGDSLFNNLFNYIIYFSHYLKIKKPLKKCKILRKWLKERYPWFELRNKDIDKDLITEIFKTQNSVRFIGSL